MDPGARYLLPYQKTGALDDAQIERLRLTLDEEEFAQELECSFTAPNSGSYYGKWIDAAIKDTEAKTSADTWPAGLRHLDRTAELQSRAQLRTRPPAVFSRLIPGGQRLACHLGCTALSLAPSPPANESCGIDLMVRDRRARGATWSRRLRGAALPGHRMRGFDRR